MEKETIYGRKIKVYNKERTICDILKDRTIKQNYYPQILNAK